MGKPGRPDVTSPKVIHFLVTQYPQRATMAEIKRETHTKSVEHPLKKLLKMEYVTVNKNKEYGLVTGRCVDIMRDYYFKEGVVTERTLEFLKSGFADETVFSCNGLHALLGRAYFKWLYLYGAHNLDALKELLSATNDPGTRRTRDLLGELAKYCSRGVPLDDMIRMLRQDDRFRDMFASSPPVNGPRRKAWDLTQKETDTICRLMRLAPSLILYISSENPAHGTPDRFLLDRSFIELMCSRSKEKQHRKRPLTVEEVVSAVNRSFKLFHFQLLYGFVVHDMAMYKVMEDKDLLRKIGSDDDEVRGVLASFTLMLHEQQKEWVRLAKYRSP